ncbi:MAG: hypothetical protein J2P15_12955 [Micromonosporaceae bacterium]|nr:hypothetical protein [Micromonosporaceae bacterium]
MGLAERRAAEQFKTEQYPEWKRRIDQAAGFEVPVEVNWDQLAVDGYAESYGQFFPKVFFEPLERALAAVTIDQMGKDALKAGLKQIIVKNSDQYGSTSGFSFTGGILTMDYKSHTNVDYGDERAKALQKLLESGL